MGSAHRKPARKRRGGTAAPKGETARKTAAAPAPRRPRSASAAAAARDERPKPPWHPVPLIELCVLVGIVLIVMGFIRGTDRTGRIMLLGGLVLASLAGFDTAVREHFAGFRSHSMLLAGMPAVMAAGGLYFAEAPWPAIVASAPIIFGLGLWFFRGAFRRASGGLSFKA